MPDRITELKSALDAVVAENDRIASTFKTEDNGGVVVSQEQADEFRANLAKGNEIKGLIEMEEAALELKQTSTRLETKDAGGGGMSAAMLAAAAAGGDTSRLQGLTGLGAPEVKMLGEIFTESDEFKALKASGGYSMREDFVIEGVDLGSAWTGLTASPSKGEGLEKKDVYTALPGTMTNRGFGSTQRDPLVNRQFRTSRVRDLFPVATTNANLIEYFRVSGFTNNAGMVPERSGGAFALKPQSALAFAPAQAPVRTIAHFEVAHRNVLADEPQLQSIINNELLYGLRLTEDYQILQGLGTGEDLLGILNTPGIQLYNQTTNGVAGDTKVDAVRRASTRAILAYYEPTGIVVHPYDWEKIELTKNNQGTYIVTTAVAIGAQQQLWRQPVVDTPAMPEGTFLTGAFGLGAQLYDRQLANIRIAEQHADFFIRNAVLVLAEQRLALAVKRPESFVKGTFT